MKLSKKFITAIAMLTLSAVMLTTSSFAWFSMNTNVKATGMTVTAKAEQVFLQISNGNKVYDANGAAGTTDMFSDAAPMLSAIAQNAGTGLKFVPIAVGSSATNPTIVDGAVTVAGSVADLVAGNTSARKWYTNYSTNPDASAAYGSYSEVGTKTNEDTLTSYCLINTFYLRLNPSAGRTTADAPLKSTVALVNTPADDMAKAVSILVVCGDMAQLWKQNAEGAWVSTGDAYLTDGAFANGDENAPVAVKVFVFFDGENANCKTTNVTANGYEVAVNFTVA